MSRDIMKYWPRRVGLFHKCVYEAASGSVAAAVVVTLKELFYMRMNFRVNIFNSSLFSMRFAKNGGTSFYTFIYIKLFRDLGKAYKYFQVL